MNRFVNLILRSRHITAVIAFFGLALLGVNAWPSAPAPQEKRLDWQKRRANLKAEDLRVDSKAQNLKVISVEKQGLHLKVTLRNDYPKTITGYEVAVGIGTIQTECLTGAHEDNTLPPGQIREENYPIQVDVDKLGIKILAVIFDDRTTDGDPKYVREIQQYRLGMKMQREHALRLLRGVMNSTAGELSAELAKLESQVSSFSTDKEQRLPALVRFGLNDERDRVLHWIKHLSRIHDAPPSVQDAMELTPQQRELNNIVERYANTVRQL